MTSVLKRYSQIDQRIRYFTSVVAQPTIRAYKLLSSARTGVVDFSDVSANGTIPSPYFLKDLGRTIYVYDASVPDTIEESPVGPQVAILREVQLVNGVSTEGVSGSSPNNFNSYWIATWTANGGTVQQYSNSANTIVLAPVARTG